MNVGKRAVKAGWVAFAVALLLEAAPAQAITIYNTTPSWNGLSSISPFGKPDTATYGQTFLAPLVDTSLDSFTFYVSPRTETSLSVKAYVYAWSGSMFGAGGGGATGSALFGSSSFLLTASGFTPVTVNTGGVGLIGGAQYVAFLTISNGSDYDDSIGVSDWGRIGSGLHVANSGGGGFVFYNNADDFGLLNTTAWNHFADFGDLAWQAEFSAPVPEPGSMLLLGAGLLGLAGRRRRNA